MKRGGLGVAIDWVAGRSLSHKGGGSMYSQAHVSSHKGASVALRDRWWLKRRRREAEGPVFAMVVPCVLNRGWKGGRPWVRLKEEPKVHKRLLGHFA